VFGFSIVLLGIFIWLGTYIGLHERFPANALDEFDGIGFANFHDVEDKGNENQESLCQSLFFSNPSTICF
jgi:hypothetical protein